ncbi:hypothetical protein F5B20DRAFT_538104 [Whalleya microplaca]|nr:hypothetical protein F5B20DRAFT_538104 [Whalleya microplaca]
MPTLTASAMKNFVICVVLMCLTAVATFVRFMIKVVYRQKPMGADWMCLLAVAFFFTHCIIIINYIFNVSVAYAFDNDLSLGVVEATNITRNAYILEILFGFGITSVKISILWFYHTIFAVHRTLRRVIQGVTVACVLWFIVATFVIVFQCHPVEAYWEHFVSPPYCLVYPRVLLGYEITNLFLDVAILCIPIAIIPRLHLERSKRVTVMVIFLLGALVCIASILRLTAIWNPPDIVENFDFTYVNVWSTLQLGLANICSCLPTFGPLLPALRKLFPYIQSWYQSIKSQLSSFTVSTHIAGSQMPDSSNAERPWVKVGDGRFDASPRTWAGGESNGSSDYALQSIPPRAILVNRDVHIV